MAMATRSGVDNELVRELNDLIEFEYDSIEAYQAAVERVFESDQAQLLRFVADHKRHIAEVAEQVLALGGEPASKKHLKHVVSKGKVVMGGLLGDQSVMMAMRSNEEALLRAFKRASEHPRISRRLASILAGAISDELRHLAFIEKRINALDPTLGG
jgi:uncharacterized protein (TIGR02284 family)